MTKSEMNAVDKPLTKSEIEDFEKRLKEMRKELLGELRGVEGEIEAPEESRGYKDSADEGTDDFMRAVDIEKYKTLSPMLRQIDRALEKIVQGTYGYSDKNPSNRISTKRLNALPHALLTIEEQSEEEKMGKNPIL